VLSGALCSAAAGAGPGIERKMRDGPRAVRCPSRVAVPARTEVGSARMFRASRLGGGPGRGATWSARSGQGERSLYRARLLARHGDGAIGSGAVGGEARDSAAARGVFLRRAQRALT
jgi:hypothetical protein